MASVSGIVHYIDRSAEKQHLVVLCSQHIRATSRSSSVARTRRLVMVRPLKTRYVATTAAIGDVVVGRIVETVLGRGQRWKVDINSQQDGHLLLSAVTLPGSAMQRKMHEDRADLEMREFFREGDVICAEVQKLYDDGGLHLHTKVAQQQQQQPVCAAANSRVARSTRQKKAASSLLGRFCPCHANSSVSHCLPSF